jgi:hypothetical protein
MLCPIRFGTVRERQLPVRGASAIAVVPGRLLVVDDDRGIFAVSRNRATLWAGPDLHPALGDLEGLAVSAKYTRVWALAEEDGAVIELSLSGGPVRASVKGHLRRPGKRKNKGFEGLAYMPARLSPSGRESLVAVHEAKPKRVSVFALPDLTLTHEVKLSDSAKDALEDLSDVTVDPVSGALLLLSDQSNRVAIGWITDGRFVMCGRYDLPLGAGEKPEGIDFASPSRLFVVTDDSAKLLDIAVLRKRPATD